MTAGGRADGGGDDGLLALARSAFGLPPPAVIGVAVSGGGDSMALLHLLARVQAARGGSVRAATVDHRLRPGSAGEARFVARAAAALGVAHETLVWNHGEVSDNLADAARRARYGLIAGWARRTGILHVAVGHTADDRAETFLMELAREAGIDGLAAMRESWRAAGITWARPLLPVGRETLRDYLRRHGMEWVEDPTNEDLRYQRARARRALAALAPLGITAGGLAHVAANLALARADLVELALRTAAGIARTDAGEVCFDRAGWMGAGNDTRRRLLIAALRWVGAADHAPRAAQLARLEAAIGEGRGATLAGCRLRCGDAAFAITREPRAVAGCEVPAGELWDRRWRLTGPLEPGLTVRALGAEGLRLCDGWRATGRSRAALVVSPAVWRGDRLVAAPVAGMANGWAAEIATDFPSALLTH